MRTFEQGKHIYGDEKRCLSLSETSSVRRAYFLANKEFEMLRDYARKGVQVVSPLTLCHKIELIKAGVHARKLSEEAENVRNDLNAISQRFSEIDGLWRVFYSTHLKNAGDRAEELDRAYKKLRDEFDRVSRMSKE
jgi:DNA recombination protein RmuC